MATMFPAEVEAFTTPGEGKTYRFLRQAARPDAEFLVWYAPDIEAREPDFLLFSPDSGLIVLEVKDWRLDQFIEADPKHVRLRISDKEECRKNPLAQAREYVHSLLSLLGKIAPRIPGGKAQIPFPIGCGVVFPHISRDEFLCSGLAKLIDPNHVLCWDEVQDHSPLVSDPSGQCFRRWMAERFPPLFSFTCSSQKLDWLRGVIFPVVRLDLPRRAGMSTAQAETIRALDHDQENLARTFGPGKRLIIGPPGSGKTLILAHQAWNLPRMDKRIKRVLMTCFNLSLRGYIRRLLARKGVSLGQEHVEVIPFYDLCERILGEHLAHAKEPGEYYQLVVQEALERLGGAHPLQGRWDAILVDEGQDFSSHMAEVLLRLLPRHGALTVAQDDNQRIYPGTGGWENMGIDGLRVQRLFRQYRSTRPIARMAAGLMAAQPAPESFAGSDGPHPIWLKCDTAVQLVERVAEGVANLVQAGVPMSEIAVLYVSTKPDGMESLPAAFIDALESLGVLSTWVTQDARSKRNYDITTDTVTISTIHSAKGLDFAHVFFLGVDTLNMDDALARRLAYVEMTRAREELTFAVYTHDWQSNVYIDIFKET